MVTRRRLTKERRPELSEGEWLFLIDDIEGARKLLDPFTMLELEFATLNHDERLRALWQENSEAVLDYWLKNFPGTRPECWWRFDAPRQASGNSPDCFYEAKLPQPRLQLGGAGVPAFQVLALVPAYAFGIPEDWCGFDSGDPPLFESQAAYLKRHELMGHRERLRLFAEDFEPEILTEDRFRHWERKHKWPGQG